MKPEIIKVERVQHGKLLRGEYVGDWSGYVISIPLQTETWRLYTKDGVRGRVPVTVKVDDAGKMEVIIEGNAS